MEWGGERQGTQWIICFEPKPGRPEQGRPNEVACVEAAVTGDEEGGDPVVRRLIESLERHEERQEEAHAAIQSVVIDNKGGGDVAPPAGDNYIAGADVFRLASAAPPADASKQFAYGDADEGEDNEISGYPAFVIEQLPTFIGSGLTRANKMKRIAPMWKEQKDVWKPKSPLKRPSETIKESTLKRPAAATKDTLKKSPKEKSCMTRTPLPSLEEPPKKKPRAPLLKFPAALLAQTGFGCSKCTQRASGCAKCNPDKKAFRAAALVLTDPRDQPSTE